MARESCVPPTLTAKLACCYGCAVTERRRQVTTASIGMFLRHRPTGRFDMVAITLRRLEYRAVFRLPAQAALSGFATCYFAALGGGAIGRLVPVSAIRSVGNDCAGRGGDVLVGLRGT